MFIIIGVQAQAQNDTYYNSKHEVAVSVGIGSNSQILNFFSDFGLVMGGVLASGMTTGGTYIGYTIYRDGTTIPPINVEYFYHVSKVIGVGGSFSYNYRNRDMYCTFQDYMSKSTTEEKVGDAMKSNLTFMLAVKFDYLRKKNFGMYSKLAVGITYMHEKETQKNNGTEKEVNKKDKVAANYHITLVGGLVGSEKFRGYSEIGMGEQGIFQLGLRYKF